MRMTTVQAALRCARSRLAGPLAFALGALLLGPAGAVMGKGNAPAVWVPAAPGTVAPGQPMVLVPYTQSLSMTAPSPSYQPWVPDYLAAPVKRGAAAPVPDAAATAPSQDSTAVPLSKVLRATHWRRNTAERLRAQPGFKPRF